MLTTDPLKVPDLSDLPNPELVPTAELFRLTASMWESNINGYRFEVHWVPPADPAGNYMLMVWDGEDTENPILVYDASTRSAELVRKTIAMLSGFVLSQ